jgi:hypothetical protein
MSVDLVVLQGARATVHTARGHDTRRQVLMFAKRYREPHPARTALAMLMMVVTPEQIAECAGALRWCAENRPTVAEFGAALDELRVAATAREDD